MIQYFEIFTTKTNETVKVEGAQGVQEYLYKAWEIKEDGSNANDFAGKMLADMFYFANTVPSCKIGQFHHDVIDGHEVRATRITKAAFNK